MTPIILVINANAYVTRYASMNELVDAEEKNIREYLKQKDDYNKCKAEIKKMEAERDELLRRADAIQKDIDGMNKI